MGGPRTVLFHGHLVDPRTAEMLTEVEAITSDTLHVWQGSYSNGAKSGGTHTGGGAVDVSPTKGSWDALVAATRQVGFAAWHRTPEQGYDPHVHAIAVGCVDLSPEAAQQVAWYRQGLNGLWPGRQGPDDGPRNHVGVTWETYQEDSMPTVKDVWEYPITRDAGSGRLVKIPMWRSVLDAVDTGRQATAAVARLTADVAGLSAAVKALAAGTSVDLDAVQAAAKAGAEQALSEGVKVDVSVGGAQ